MNILNFGSLNIDYVYEVEHFVRKGETISSKNLRVSCGGKGLNQSVALSRAGLHVYHAGMIGTDGTFLEDILKDAGVDTRYVMTSEQTRTGNAIIQNDAQGDNCILLYGGANQAVTREFIDCVLKNFEKDDWLLLQNEINEIEAQELIKDTGNDNVLLEKVHAAFPHAEIVLTLGERGALYLGKEGHITQESYPVTAIDTTAAGDTFTGYYLAGQLKGFCAKESMQMAAKAASITVSRKGAALSIPKIDEILSTK